MGPPLTAFAAPSVLGSAQLGDHALDGVAGAHAEAGEDDFGLLEEGAAGGDVAALDAEGAEALEADRQLGVVADLAEEGDAALEEVFGFLAFGAGVVEQG